MRHEGPSRLMIVDDEPEIRGMLADFLAHEGYVVGAASGGAELDDALAAGEPDLILLDVAMPGEDGLSIARRVKASRTTPIIMLSALGDTVDRIVGLEVGADDYIAKPFDVRELRARVRAVLRRGDRAVRQPEPPAAATASADLVPFGEAMLSISDRTLIGRDGELVTLTPTEFDMVETFLRFPNRVLSRDRLAAPVTPDAPCPLDRAVDIRVTRIRKKIEADPHCPRIIRTVRGAGYIYVPKPAPA
ncbi:MAG: response regulator [Mesorhizobium sp.]|nr:response regulator [Mesorhizobium sp.]MCO5160420.1 response regulator [Mesorhizobium sp.]